MRKAGDVYLQIINVSDVSVFHNLKFLLEDRPNCLKKTVETKRNHQRDRELLFRLERKITIIRLKKRIIRSFSQKLVD